MCTLKQVWMSFINYMAHRRCLLQPAYKGLNTIRFLQNMVQLNICWVKGCDNFSLAWTPDARGPGSGQGPWSPPELIILAMCWCLHVPGPSVEILILVRQRVSIFGMTCLSSTNILYTLTVNGLLNWWNSFMFCILLCFFTRQTKIDDFLKVICGLYAMISWLKKNIDEDKMYKMFISQSHSTMNVQLIQLLKNRWFFTVIQTTLAC